MPDDENPSVEITGVYGAEEARQVIKLSLKDYEDNFIK
jgi:inorganic pyrophosphatase